MLQSFFIVNKYECLLQFLTFSSTPYLLVLTNPENSTGIKCLFWTNRTIISLAYSKSIKFVPTQKLSKIGMTLTSRVDNAMTIKVICEMFFAELLNNEKLVLLKQQNRLSNSWMDKVLKRSANSKVKNWNSRLLGHA